MRKQLKGLIVIFYLLTGCRTQKDNYIYIVNNYNHPITIDYHAFDHNYFVGMGKKYSKKDKNALMFYNPLFCKKCKLSTEGENLVKIILPPKDTIAVSNRIGLNHELDVVAISNFKVYPTDSAPKESTGFDYLNYFKSINTSMYLIIDSLNLFSIYNSNDSLNNNCIVFERKNFYYDYYKICKRENDTIKITSFGFTEKDGKKYEFFQNWYFLNQREIFLHGPRLVPPIYIPKK
jgi:hypothetical protein